MKKKIFLIIRILIAVLLLSYLLFNIDLGEFWNQIRYATPWLIILGLSVYSIIAVLAIIRWKLLLDVHHVYPSWAKLTKLFFVGLFFNNAMPGLTGGDVIKAYYVAKETDQHKPEAVTTVFIDRIVGVVGLIMIGLIALMFNLQNPQFRKLAIILCCLFAAIMFFTPLFLSKNLLRKIPFLDKIPFAETLKRIYHTFYKYKTHKSVIIFGLLLSMTLQCLYIIMVALMGKSISLNELHISHYFLFIPVISTISALPLSISGLGVNEQLYVYCFGLVGAGKESAFAIALMARFALLLWGLPGWFFYMALGDKNVSGEMMQREIDVLEENVG